MSNQVDGVGLFVTPRARYIAIHRPHAVLVPQWNCIFIAILAFVSLLFSAELAHAGFQVTASTVAAGTSLDGGPDAMIAAYSVGKGANGDHASCIMSYDAFIGLATLTTHACVNPQPNLPGGGAQGEGNIAQAGATIYQVVSDTLPVGTPVEIMVCVAAARSSGASYSPPKTGPGFGDFADAGISVSINIFGAVFTGSAYDVAYHMSPPDDSVYTGLFLKAADAQSITITRLVGDLFAVNANFVAVSRASAIVVGAYGDGRACGSLRWGAAVVDADAQIRSIDDNSPFPGLNECTPEAAVAALPPLPPLGDCNGNGECPDGYYCNTMPGNCDGTGVCTPIPDGCSGEFKPVCGCDGQDYINACVAAQAGISVASQGQCNPSIECSDSGVCPPDDYCMKAEGDCEGQGICTPRPIDCPDIDDPVCGCDNRNFQNACYAASAGVSVAYDGPCIVPCIGDIAPGGSRNDGVVNVLDLLELLSEWGPCTDCASDFNDDDIINVLDMLSMLSAWGPCQR